MAGPVKRSINVAGHATSITLEPVFWDALVRAATEESLPLSALVARIDAERAEARDMPNLASAIRVWLFLRALGAAAIRIEPSNASDIAVNQKSGAVSPLQPDDGTS